jgi:uncharacterized protein YbjT (DUF2867 family)
MWLGKSVERASDFKKGERNMNSLKDKVAVSADAKYVILGASGSTGSIIARTLLSKGKKVRVVGRDAQRLQYFVRQGAEEFTGDVSDAAALTKAFTGARAAYLLLPPITSRENQERESDAIAQAVTESGLPYAVYLSSYGAHVPEGTGPVTGLHSSEPDLKLPVIATRDVGNYAAQRLLELDFSGKQTRELLGERDLSMAEATTIIARGIGKPDLRYEQFSYDQVQQVLEQMGMTPKKAAVYIEMFKAINASVLAAQEPRSRENTTPTSFEQFVQDVFAPAYHGKAHAA